MTTKLTKDNIDNLKNFAVSWQSVITADGSTNTNVESGKGYFIDTTSNTHTVVLPSSASIGDIIRIKDYAGTFGSNALTINRNGHNIQGVANDSLINTNRASISLFYVDSTKGWLFANESNVAALGSPAFTSATGGTITTSGDFKIHTFTGDGCFVVSTVGNSPVAPTGGPTNVDYLVVAGGGGGGKGEGGGGGGAGGYRTTFPSPGCNAGSFPVTATTYPITVGGGGAGSTTGPVKGSPGSNSVFSTITSTGGGGGGSYACSMPGATGGSGGGGSGQTGNPGTGGSGNTPPVSPSQGNNGGAGTSDCATYRAGGGGGGVGGVGTAGASPSGGPGGTGTSNLITGSPVTYAGGGGGAGQITSSGTGGSGVGGAGGRACSPANTPGGSGTTNTGGGGGGGGSTTFFSGAGGKGIVIIRYKYQ